MDIESLFFRERGVAVDTDLGIHLGTKRGIENVHHGVHALHPVDDQRGAFGKPLVPIL